MHNRSGSTLIFIVLILALSLALSAFLVKIVYNDLSTVSASMVREQAFALAEAGIEKGKLEVAHDPNWYTDLPHYPEDNAPWLINSASGFSEALGDGQYKIIREKGKDRIYAVGFKDRGVVILKLTLSPGLNWEEL